MWYCLSTIWFNHSIMPGGSEPCPESKLSKWDIFGKKLDFPLLQTSKNNYHFQLECELPRCISMWSMNSNNRRSRTRSSSAWPHIEDQITMSTVSYLQAMWNLSCILSMSTSYTAKLLKPLSFKKFPKIYCTFALEIHTLSAMHIHKCNSK